MNQIRLSPKIPMTLESLEYIKKIEYHLNKPEVLKAIRRRAEKLFNDWLVHGEWFVADNQETE